MQPISRTLSLGLFVVLSSAPAIAQTATPPAMAGMQSPADQSMMAGMTKMSQAMAAAKMTGDPDRDFVAMMIPHHEGAVDMAEVELKYGKDPMLRRLASAIVTAQKKEIAEMRSWQAKHPGS